MPGGIFSEFMSDTSRDVQIQQTDLQGILTDSTVSDARGTDSIEQKSDWMPDVFQDFVEDFGFDLSDFLRNPFLDSGSDISPEELEQKRDEEFEKFCDVWTDAGCDNCIAFASGWLTDPVTGRYFDHKPAPGDISGRLNGDYMPYFDDVVYSMNPDEVRSTLEYYWGKDCAVQGQELIPVDSADYELKEDERLVAMMYSDIPGLEDFHFMLKGDYGTWYHKPGLMPPTRTDDSGQIITDPATCDRGIYDHFCGYYIIRDMH